MCVPGNGGAEVVDEDVPIEYELQISLWIDLIIPKQLIVFHSIKIIIYNFHDQYVSPRMQSLAFGEVILSACVGLLVFIFTFLYTLRPYIYLTRRLGCTLIFFFQDFCADFAGWGSQLRRASDGQGLLGEGLLVKAIKWLKVQSTVDYNKL
jgi:hypothetical protein